MVVGSMYCVVRVLVVVAIASLSLEDDCLKDLQTRILPKPVPSTPEGLIIILIIIIISHNFDIIIIIIIIIIIKV